MDVDALERRRQQAHGARHGGAPAHPVPHREALEEALLAGLAVERAAVLRDRRPRGGRSRGRARHRPRPLRACRCASRACRPTSRSRARASPRAPRPGRPSTRSKPSGSVLSRKCGRMRSARPPSASATSCGPSAEPPMPITSTWRKRSARGGRTRPSWTRAAKSSTRACVSRIAAAISGVGRPLRRAQPVVARPSASRPGWRGSPARARPSPERLGDRGLALDERGLGESHAAHVEPEPERGLVEQQRLVALPERAWGHHVPHSTGARPVKRDRDRRCAGPRGERHSWPRLEACPRDSCSCSAAALAGLVRGRLLADRLFERLREQHVRQLHHPRSVQLRARRAPGVLLLVPGAAEPRPGLLQLARGLPRRRALPDARLELQLHHVEGLERRLLLGKPVHRLRPLLQAYGRPGAAAHADLPGQPGSRGRSRPRSLPRVGQWQDRRGPDPHRRDRDDLRPGAGRGDRRDRVARPRRPGAAGDAHQAAGDDPHRLADRGDRVGIDPRRLSPLPQLRAALDRGPQHRVPAAAGPGGERAGAGPALQRRRARLGGAAPRRPDRRAAARGPGVRPVHPQRQADEPRHGLPLREQAAGARRQPAGGDRDTRPPPRRARP